MKDFTLPTWPQDWVYFADIRDGILALAALLLLLLLVIWWRQQTRNWFRVVVGTFLAALLLCLGSYYFFIVPPHYASCPPGCTGWRGFPLPVARIALDGETRVFPLDFMFNLLMLWLLWLGARLVWRLAAMAIHWENRNWRVRLTFVVLLVFLPWALLPRIFD